MKVQYGQKKVSEWEKKFKWRTSVIVVVVVVDDDDDDDDDYVRSGRSSTVKCAEVKEQIRVEYI